MAREHLSRRHGRRLPHRGRDLRVAEHGRRLGHDELAEAGEPRGVAAGAQRHARQERAERQWPEGRPHSDDRGGLRQPPGDPRHGDRAARQSRVHHHQALSAHRRRTCHRTSRRCRRTSSLQSLQALFGPDAGRRGRRNERRAASRQRHRGRRAGRDPAAVRRRRAQAGRGQSAGRRGGREFRLR